VQQLVREMQSFPHGLDPAGHTIVQIPLVHAFPEPQSFADWQRQRCRPVASRGPQRPEAHSLFFRQISPGARVVAALAPVAFVEPASAAAATPASVLSSERREIEEATATVKRSKR